MSLLKIIFFKRQTHRKKWPAIRLHFLKYELLCDSRANLALIVYFYPAIIFISLWFSLENYSFPHPVRCYWYREIESPLMPWRKRRVCYPVPPIRALYPLVNSNWLRGWVCYPTSTNRRIALYWRRGEKRISLYFGCPIVKIQSWGSLLLPFLPQEVRLTWKKQIWGRQGESWWCTRTEPLGQPCLDFRAAWDSVCAYVCLFCFFS